MIVKQVILVGDGGHSKVVQECLMQQKEYTIIGTLDNNYTTYEKVDEQFRAPFTDYEKYKADDVYWFIAIGNNNTRATIAEKLGNVSYATIIHPTAVISQKSVLEQGSIVMPHAIIQPAAIIRKHVIVNTAAIIEHDVIIDEYAHISPRATITGGVKIGVCVHVGAAVVTPQVSLGDYSTIGAGAVVTRDTAAYQIYVGVPAKRLVNKRKEKYD
ncbi:acetyltransferase [Listeria ivanovii]|nr:acetyltransferase [Listeria ivanovii]